MVRILPLVLIAMSIFSVFTIRIHFLQKLYTTLAIPLHIPMVPVLIQEMLILTNFNESQIPTASLLMLYYIAIFAAAEAAFVLMAIKEYLQDSLRFSEDQIIAGQLRTARERIITRT